MCRRPSCSHPATSSGEEQRQKQERTTSNFSVPRLPLWFVFGLIPFLPASFFLNQGYTKWCHWLCVAHVLTGSRALARFICVQSLLINVGWYCTLFADWWCDGRAGDILFRNMPPSIARHMVAGERDNVSGRDVPLLDTPESRASQALSVALDLLFHPILCIAFWHIAIRQQQQQQQPQQQPQHYKIVNEIVTWPMLGAAIALSRTWSILHNWHHYYSDAATTTSAVITTMIAAFPKSLYYYGTHVYKVHAASDHLWTAAYVGETVTIVLIVLYKLFHRWKEQRAKGGPS